MIDRHSDDYLLPDHESRRIFREEIVPEKLSGARPGSQPEVIVIIAQPGTGKSRINDDLRSQFFAELGGAIPLDSDLYKPYHPAYARLLAGDDQVAAQLVRPDGRRWMESAQDYVRQHRLHALCDWTANDPADLVRLMGQYREDGFRSTAVIMAAHEAVSRLGIMERYFRQRQADEVGRLTQTENHDRSYPGVLTTCDAIDTERLTDSVFVLSRDGKVLYYNQIGPDGQWLGVARTRAVVEAERSRPWSTEESLAFLTQIDELRHGLGPEWHAKLDAIAELARPMLTPDTDLAAARGKRLDIGKLTEFDPLSIAKPRRSRR